MCGVLHTVLYVGTAGEVLVLDEAGRLFDQGFEPQVRIAGRYCRVHGGYCVLCTAWGGSSRRSCSGSEGGLVLWARSPFALLLATLHLASSAG